jgi:hypothetical protein
MSRKLAFVLGAIVVLGLCAAGWAQPSYVTKVAQLPDWESGWNLQSQWDLIDGEPNIIHADNWRCPDGLAVTDIHWWGSYLFNARGSKPIDQFEVSIYANDVGTGLPGQLLHREAFGFPSVGEVLAGTDANGEDVYKYTVYLKDPFEQTAGEVYWLSIVALTEGTTRWPMWGWHTAVTTDIEQLLQGSAQTTKDPTQDSTLGGKAENPWQDAQYEMAFELTTIPEPSIVALVGLGLFAMWTRFRRR